MKINAAAAFAVGLAAAVTAGKGGIVMAAEAVAETGFTCDFEWLETLDDYRFVDVENAEIALRKADDGNTFLELSAIDPESLIVFTANVNMFYKPGSIFRFSHAEPGAERGATVEAELITENDASHLRGNVPVSEGWRTVALELGKLPLLEGKPLTSESIPVKLSIRAKGVGKLLLDNVSLDVGEAPVVVSEADPAFFNWRRNLGWVTLEYSRRPDFPEDATFTVQTSRNYYMPDSPMGAGVWYWRVTPENGSGLPVESLEISADARRFTLPDVDVAAITSKPRPWLNRKRDLSAEEREELLKKFDYYYSMKPGENPPRYTPGDPRFPSMISWYGAVHDRIVISCGVRLQTIAEILAWTGDESLAPRVLEYAKLLCKWNPEDGSSHSAGDIGAYHVQRGLDAAYDALLPIYGRDELKFLEEMIKLRAQQVWRALNPFPRGLRKEYNNHAWLSVYGMAEGALVTLDTFEDAADYLNYSKDLFAGLFLPVQGFDGENGEGVIYWSYGGNFLKLYAEMMKNVCGLNFFKHPWLGRTIMFPIYTCIPQSYAISFANTGKPNHDLKGPVKNESHYIDGLAVSSDNPYGVWYANVGGEASGVAARIPAKLTPSIFYPHIGWAVFNTTLVDGGFNVSAAMRAGTFASGHQHDDQNSILVNAYGDKLLINSGYYDYYGSRHFDTYSTLTAAHNTIAVDGETQGTRRTGAGGELTTFSDGKHFGYAVGEAGNPTVNGGKLSRWTRRLIFIKPEFVITHDIINAVQPVKLSYLAHSAIPLFAYQPNQYFDIIGEKAELYARIVTPELVLNTSTGYPVSPVRPRGNNEPLDEDVISREWHLSADAPEPVTDADIMVVMQIRKQPVTRAGRAKITRLECENGTAAKVTTEAGKTYVVMSNLTGGTMTCGDLSSDAEVLVVEYDSDGTEVRRFSGDDPSRETYGDAPSATLWGAELKGEYADRADGRLYYYSGMLTLPEETELTNPYGDNVSLLVDMERFSKGKLAKGNHFITITATEPLE